MSHIFQIELNNFRAFKEKTFFEFANISVLTGTNSSGKSSLINALTILKNYFKDLNSYDELDNILSINSLLELDVKDIGERLGNFSKILNNKTGSQTLSITIPTLFRGIIDKIELRLSIEMFPNDLHTGHLTHLEFFSQKSNLPVFSILNKEFFEVFINYKYFWTEFKRESRQMLRYFSVEDEISKIRKP